MSGFEPLNYLVSELTLEDRLALRSLLGARLRRRGGPPVIELVGVRPAEADRFLNRLYRRHLRLIPVNAPTLPFEATDERDKQALRQDVVNCLWYLSTRAQGLGCYVRNRPQIKFPRFTLGFLVYQWAQNRDVKELATIAKGLQTVRQVQDAPQPAPEGISAALLGLGTPGALAALGLELAYLLVPGNRHRKGVRWWGRTLDSPSRWLHRPRGGVLEYMYNLVAAGVDDRDRPLEALLAAALLADLDAYYNALRRWNRDRLPLVLVPGSHTPGGKALLRAFRGAYQRVYDPLNARWYRPVTRPVVIAVGEQAGVGAESLSTVEQRLKEWAPRPGQRGPERWMLRAVVPPQREGEQ
ncbi:hypothetical protein ACFQVC_36490 [Streptomyces monticola]|uniref:Uncharacterized protein n=1 Tax=Streptomyces monticola TaxID=2666263 RepID=A0ABW2JWC0_9ACTN